VENETREGISFSTDNARCSFARTAIYVLFDSVLTASFFTVDPVHNRNIRFTAGAFQTIGLQSFIYLCEEKFYVSTHSLCKIEFPKTNWRHG
jgi:hypothetical protein